MIWTWLAQRRGACVHFHVLLGQLLVGPACKLGLRFLAFAWAHGPEGYFQAGCMLRLARFDLDWSVANDWRIVWRYDHETVFGFAWSGEHGSEPPLPAWEFIRWRPYRDGIVGIELRSRGIAFELWSARRWFSWHFSVRLGGITFEVSIRDNRPTEKERSRRGRRRLILRPAWAAA